MTIASIFFDMSSVLGTINSANVLLADHNENPLCVPLYALCLCGEKNLSEGFTTERTEIHRGLFEDPDDACHFAFAVDTFEDDL